MKISLKNRIACLKAEAEATSEALVELEDTDCFDGIINELMMLAYLMDQKLIGEDLIENRVSQLEKAYLANLSAIF